MNDLKEFSHNVGEALATKAEESTKGLSNDLQKVDPPTEVKIPDTKRCSTIKGVDMKQKEVLEIPQTHSKYFSGSQKDLKGTTQIELMEKQKKKILDELQKVNEELYQARSNSHNKDFLKKVKISTDQAAKKHAQEFVKEMKMNKHLAEEKKRKETEKMLRKVKKEEEEKKREREKEMEQIREEKQRALEEKMEQEKKRREQRKILDKQSNQLIAHLKKEHMIEKEHQKEMEATVSQVLNYECKKNLERKRWLDIHQIDTHQRNYQRQKSKEKELMRKSHHEAAEIKNPIKKYGKNIWVEQLQQQQREKQEEIKQKEMQRKTQFEKRMKYAEIVKSVFKPKQKKKQTLSADKQDKENSQPQISQLPKILKIPQSQKGIMSETRFSKKRLMTVKHEKGLFDAKTNEQQSIKEEKQSERERKLRQIELRRETKERLKRISANYSSLPKVPSSKIKYENYLGRVNIQHQELSSNWERILNNQQLTDSQKYQAMLKKVSYMEERAKKVERTRDSGDHEAVDLYVNSIQAKLAVLEKF